jgi:hypothetical protein
MTFDERQDGVLLHHTHFDQRFTESQSFLRTLGKRLVELLRSNELGTDELLTEGSPIGASGSPWSFGRRE